MRINVQQRDRRERGLFYESIPDTNERSSWTWPEFRLGENSGIDVPEADAASAAAPVEWFNLQGVPVSNPAGGIFIRRQGAKVTKAIVK